MMGYLEDVERELAELEATQVAPRVVNPPRELREHVEMVGVAEKSLLESHMLKGIGDLNDLIEAAQALKGSLINIIDELRKRS